MGDIALVEEAFKKVGSVKGCKGIMIMNGDGIAIRTTMENDVTVHYAAVVSSFIKKTRSAVWQIDPDDELQFVRIRSQKHEILVAPDYGKNHEYYMTVVQSPSTK